MKFFFWSLALIVPSTVVAQNRDPSPAVPPGPASAVTTTTGQANASEPAPSATGAPAPANNKPIALKIVGSNVKNLKGKYLGKIEGVALKQERKKMDYALLNTEYPKNRGRVTRVPWQNPSYV